jgi:hypothetical protein
MKNGVIERRKALKYIGLVAGTAAGQEFLASWLPRNAGLMAAPQSASAAPVTSAPRFFQPDEFKTVQTLAEIIIPTDDRPGAREARVADYIDFTVHAAAEFEPTLQKKWIEGLAMLDRLSREQLQKPFSALKSPRQERLLTEISVTERDPQARHPGFEFYRLVKGMSVEGFYTSEVGLIDVLEFKGNTFLSEFPGCTHPEHQA